MTKIFRKKEIVPAVDEAPEFRCIVNADLFRRARLAISRDETRYYLSGVFVEPCPEGGALLTATDGHCLLSFRDPLGVVQGSGIVSLNAAMARELTTGRDDLFVTKAKGFPERVVVVKGNAVAYIVASSLPKTIDGETIEPRDSLASLFEVADNRVIAAQFRDVVVDGAFPDYRNIIPTDLDENARIGSFNITILARLGEALNTTKRTKNVKLIPSKGPDSTSAPHVVIGQDGKTLDGFGIAMPLRWIGPEALPAWVKPKAKQP